MTLKVENTYLFSRWQHISLRIVKNRPLTRPPEKFWPMTCHFLFIICNFNVSLTSLFNLDTISILEFFYINFYIAQRKFPIIFFAITCFHSLLLKRSPLKIMNDDPMFFSWILTN